MTEEYDEEVVEWLKRSREQVGELEPVYITSSGEVIDGRHRLKAYSGWRTEIVQADDVKKVVERVHRNIHRRMSKKETKEAIIQLALAFERSGVPKDELVEKIKSVLPFSEDYIRRLLPAKFKREYRRREKPAVKLLAEKPAPTVTPTAPKPEKKFLTCPVCGSKLTLKGDVLIATEI